MHSKMVGVAAVETDFKFVKLGSDARITGNCWVNLKGEVISHKPH